LQGQQNSITLVMNNLHISVNCNIKSSPRKTNEKYISAADWVAFVNNANLQAGSRLRFTLADPPQVLNVVIINPNV
jgi:hypothetical protein